MPPFDYTKPPNFKHVLDDKKRGVRFVVCAYRRLSRDEVIEHIKVFLSGKNRKPKQGETITIHTVED
jgi:hypothetical protein